MFLVLLTASLFFTTRLGAVQSNGGYVATAPTVTNWNTGWGTESVTGWDYLGQVGGATGVYLGNNWVLTAAHVNYGDYTLNGTTYTRIAGSTHSLTLGNNLADLVLFQIASGPSLPSLALADSSMPSIGSTVVMTGFGGGQGKTWGANTVSKNSFWLPLTGYPYVTADFKTNYGNGNTATLVSGDSGGADFIYSGNQWLLAGINEAVDGSNTSYMVQLGYYADKISPIAAVPEPDAAALLGMGLSLLTLRRRNRRLG